MLKVKKVYVGVVFNNGTGEWIPKFVFEDAEVAYNWMSEDKMHRRVHNVTMVTDGEVSNES